MDSCRTRDPSVSTIAIKWVQSGDQNGSGIKKSSSLCEKHPTWVFESFYIRTT